MGQLAPLNDTVDEVHQYISRNHDMEEEWDLLGWWKNNSRVFLLLSRLARSILSIPASSSSSERETLFVEEVQEEIQEEFVTVAPVLT